MAVQNPGQVNGAVQVLKYIIIGLLYIAVLFVIADTFRPQFLQVGALNYITDGLRGSLRSNGDNAKIVLVGAFLFLGIISGIMVNDLVKKFSLISLFILLVVTAIDFAPIKILIEGGVK